MNIGLKAIKWWFKKNNMVLSISKTNYLCLSLRREVNFKNKVIYKCNDCLYDERECSLCSEIEGVDNVKYLGVILDKELTWKNHIIKNNLGNKLRIFYFLRNMCNDEVLRTLYFSLVHSRIDYGISIWGGIYSNNIKPLITVQKKKFIRLIKNKNRFETTFPIFKTLNILPLRYLFVYKVLRIFFLRSRNSSEINAYRHRLRNAGHVFVPKPSKTYFTKTLNFLAPRVFNKVPEKIRNLNSIEIFSRKLRTWLFTVMNIDDLLTV